MFRYFLVALALKIFSINNSTRLLYRKIGNILGQDLRKRGDIDSYIKRGNLFIDLLNKYSVVNEGDKLLEIGTGWIHWYSIYLRLYYNVSVTMFDIWDNRQFIALKSLFSKLKTSIKTDAHPNYERIVELLERNLAVNSFEELYALLDLQYVVEKTGCLYQFPDNSFNCVFSFHVLEHIPQHNFNEVVRDFYRILKPGGYSIHQIGIDDHLSHYDKNESPKNYLRYSDRTWKMLFENKIQYFNRLQMSDWLSSFKSGGFSFVKKITESCDIESIRINPKYQHYEKEDLACISLTIVHRKPK